jgi:protein-S-isoprenylcysteine O-methyltransferase Ste14
VERLGAGLFDRRRSIHLVLFVTAVVLGDAQREAMVVGGVLLTLHLAARLWVCRHLRGAARVHARKAQERKVLVTGGPFALVRNPLYVANTIGITGACLLFGPAWFAAVAAGASILWYAVVVRWEELVLTRLYADDYRRYCTLVPRFLPRLRARVGLPRADARDLYPWLKVLRRERGSIVLQFVSCSMAILNEAML